MLYKKTETAQELLEIQALQTENLPKQLNEETKLQQGFVTVQHSFEQLEAMHKIHPHCIAVDRGKVIGYALSMSASFRNDIAVLKPMFDRIDQSAYGTARYMVMGQVCIHKEYRGQGVFRKLYQTMQTNFQQEYDLIITEIDSSNQRSLNAHKAIGFEEVLRYPHGTQTWVIVSLAL